MFVMLFEFLCVLWSLFFSIFFSSLNKHVLPNISPTKYPFLGFLLVAEDTYAKEITPSRSFGEGGVDVKPAGSQPIVDAISHIYTITHIMILFFMFYYKKKYIFS